MNLSGVLLYVRDVDRSLGFYRDVLGVPGIRRLSEYFAIVPTKSADLYLHQDPSPCPPLLSGLGAADRRGLGVVIHFQHKSVDECARRVKECGYSISQEPNDKSFGRRQMYLYDPDGYNVVVEQVQSRRATARKRK